jgi:hypothetical protein
MHFCYTQIKEVRMTRLWRNFIFIFMACSVFGLLQAQPVLTCQSTAVPPIVAAEGITERIGDIVMNCTGGTPGARVTGNFSVFLNVNITNRVSGNTVTDVVFTVDNGAGPQPVNAPGTLVATNQLVYNGLSFTLSSSGTALLRIANVRAAANLAGLGPNNPVNAFLAFNLPGPPSTNSQHCTPASLRRLCVRRKARRFPIIPQASRAFWHRAPSSIPRA